MASRTRKIIFGLIAAVIVFGAAAAVTAFQWLRSPSGVVYSFLMDIQTDNYDRAYDRLSSTAQATRDRQTWTKHMDNSVGQTYFWTAFMHNIRYQPWTLVETSVDAAHYRVESPTELRDILNNGQSARLAFTVERLPDASLRIVDDNCLWGPQWLLPKGGLYRLLELDKNTKTGRQIGWHKTGNWTSYD